MRLDAFRVQNYKKVRDTGWVTCRDLIVFVGKNEAGKSAVFRGLSKLNPSDAAPASANP
jgi:predicted ATPase